MFPPILLFSTKLFWLTPRNPRPKLLLLSAEGDALEVAEPLPLKVFNRTRLWLLPAIQVPPHDAPFEPPASLANTFSSKVLSDVLMVCMPLQQLLYTVTFFTVTSLFGWPVNPRRIPHRSKCWMIPGPSIFTSVLSTASMPTPYILSAGRLQPVGGVTGPVKVCPLRRSLM